HGYTEDEHAQGWSLLHAVTGYRAPAPPFAVETDPAVRGAIVELDAWDEPNFARVRAMLERRFPAQAAFVFQDLEAAQGVAAVLSVAPFLVRVDQLESGLDRKVSRKDDLAALALLEERGYGKKVREGLKKLVLTAQKGADAAPAAATDAKADKARAEHAQALV